MTDEVVISALARGKPVAARRVQPIVDRNTQLEAWMAEYGEPLIAELERAQAKITAAQAIVEHARKWAAHDDALAAALARYRELPL